MQHFTHIVICMYIYITYYVTGFAKTDQTVTRTKPNGKLKPNINDTLIPALSSSINYVAIDNQVCFHR